MATLNVTGQENIIHPGFYMPNRLSIGSGKALHHLLGGKVSYLVDPTYPPAEDIMDFLKRKGGDIVYFDFRKTTSRAVREQIQMEMEKGRSVVFLPGHVAKTRGCIADVPSPFLSTVGSLHISPIPLFLAYYGNDLMTLYRDAPDDGNYREEFCILPQLAPGPQTGERLLAAWMQKGQELFSAHPLLRSSLTTMLVKSMKEHPKAEVIDGLTHTSLPFFKLLGVAMTVSKWLTDSFPNEKRLGVILPPGPGCTIATVACLLSGITPVMVNYACTKASFESMVRQSGVKHFITAAKFRQKLPTFPWPEEDKLVFVENLLHNLSKASVIRNVLLAKATPAALLCRMFGTDSRSNNDEAVLLFTSGSSGEPKGVALTHRMILANCAQCLARFNLGSDEKFLASLPVFHSFGLTITTVLPLLTGFGTCAFPSPTEARNLCDLVKRYKLTLVCATPTFARAMLRRADDTTFRSVRHFIVGAEKLQPALEEEFKTRCGVTLLEGYGLTEAAPVCAVNVPDAPPLPGSAFYVPGLVKRSIGAALPGIAVRITDVDDENRILPLTEQGMLWIKGANIFGGYIGKPELNNDIFNDGWFKTGDIGKLDLNGFIRLGGRLSRFSKVGGEMVPHESVEQAIVAALQLDIETDGAQIAVTGVADAQKGEALVLLSTLPQHQRSSEEKAQLGELRSKLMEANIPNLWTPKYIVPVESIPMLPTGKLDLRGCKLLAEEALAQLNA